MRIFLTGGTGFLGKHLGAALTLQKHDVIISNRLQYNLAESSSLVSLGKSIKFDIIIHLAVKTEAGGYSQRHPGEQFIFNQVINTNILKYWQQCQPQALFVAMGSSCGYDEDLVEKTPEHYLYGRSERGYEAHAWTKKSLLMGMQSFEKEYGMRYQYYIPTSFYGDGYNLEDKHFIFDLVRKICDAKYKGTEPVVLWGDGSQKRDLIYVTDAVDIIIQNLNEDTLIANLSSGAELSIKEYSKIICDLVGYDFNKIKFDTSQFVGARSRNLVPGFPNYKFKNINEGIGKTLAYYLTKKSLK